MPELEIPFTTNNALLALSLYLAGVPFENEKVPVTNLYDAVSLHGLFKNEPEYGGKSVEWFKSLPPEKLEALAREAFDNNARGRVEYGFRTVPLLPEMQRAFDDQQKALKDTEETFSSVMARIMEGFKSGKTTREEAIVRITCALLKARPDWNDLWRQYPPLLRIDSPGEPIDKRKPDGSGRVRFPGFKTFSLNAGKEIRKKLKL